MARAQQVAKLEGEDAAVPQCAARDIGRGGSLVRLFLKARNFADGLFRFRYDVPELGARVGRLNAHQGQVGGVRPAGQRGHLAHGGKVAVIHIRVNRADDNRLFRPDILHIGQVGAGEHDRREGIPPAGFDTDCHLAAELVLDRADLPLAGGHHNVGGGVGRFDLAVDPLHHTLLAAVRRFEQRHKLFGAD